MKISLENSLLKPGSLSLLGGPHGNSLYKPERELLLLFSIWDPPEAGNAQGIPRAYVPYRQQMIRTWDVFEIARNPDSAL